MRTAFAEKQLIDTILRKGKRLKKELIQGPGTLLRLVRRRLRITQTQLAKISGVPQTNIASIESGKKRPTLATLNKLFAAMSFELAITPVCSSSPDELIRAQAQKAAKKNLDPVFSTMALEDQIPSPRKIKEMINNEAGRLMESETARIWDE
ncbi:MAG: hypothetical protein K1000chlam2_00603 [Chlamydiae bacterium]|nr:hypothetical protein [Chlamydiota bacterium]